MSKKVTPAARHASYIAEEAASSAVPPNCMAPKHRRETGMPSGAVI